MKNKKTKILHFARKKLPENLQTQEKGITFAPNPSSREQLKAVDDLSEELNFF